METVVLKPLQHNGVLNIGLYFPNIGLLRQPFRKMKEARWSRTHKCWHVLLSKKNHEEIIAIFKGKAIIAQEELLQYLSAKNKQPVPAVAAQATKVKARPPAEPVKKGAVQFSPNSATHAQYKSNAIHAVNAHIIPAMQQHLQLKSYSSSTQRTYLNELSAFLKTIGSTRADSFTTQRLKDYLQYCSVTLKLSENTLHSRMNALKFYYEQVLKKEKLFWEIPRPRKALQLPSIFSKEDVQKIIKGTENNKHKTMLILTYSSGLRVSEIVALKTVEIDSKRMVINIRKAKGKKDRVLTLSKTTLRYLRSYYIEFKPTVYLFEGQTKGQPYSTRSLQLVLEKAKKKAGITVKGSVHALRHSYATHLLDKGVDITYIQKLLGHNDLKTTLRYLHVTIRDLQNIESPIEDLDL